MIFKALKLKNLQFHNKNFFSFVNSFTDLEQLNRHLEITKPTFSLIYFHSDWNPQCQEADKHAEELGRNNAFLQVIKIDSQKSLKIARHYSVKYEPQFVFCLFGDQVVRQIGLNRSGLQKKLQRVIKLSRETDFTDYAIKWVPYGTASNQYFDLYLKKVYAWNRL